MNILGISAYYHDSAACLVKDGCILAAAQEERFTRRKHDHAFPENAIKFCEKYGIKLHHVSFKEQFGHSLCYLTSLLRGKGFKLNSCTVCGVLRRYLVNKHCRIMKASKVALGHNLDDEAQAIMMNFFRGNPEMSARIGPISGLIKDKRFVPRIKPIYLNCISHI